MRRILGLALALALAAGSAQAEDKSPYPVTQGKTYKFEKIADGVYYATGGFGSNNVVIVNDSDVLIVDTGTTAANARAFVADIKMLTPKPIRYVVNTHWHFDHTDGNSIFGPEVQILAHDYVRQALTTFDVLNREPFLTSQKNAVPAQIADLQKQIAAEKNAAKKSDLSKQLAQARQILADLKEIRPTPPNVTYSSKMVLHRGGREIDLLFLGRGHTGGDTVVYLPKEKIIATGDLVVGSLPFMYMGDGFVNEWPDTMEKILQIDFETIVPGHGDPFKDKDRIRKYQSYLRDLWTQAGDLKKQGLSSDEAARKVDLTSHKGDFANLTAPGVDPRAMLRIYDVMDGRLTPR